VHERGSRRRQIIDALTVTSQVTAPIFHGKGRDADIQAESFHRMVQPLLDLSVIESIESAKAATSSTDKS